MPRRKPPEDPFNLREKPYWHSIKIQFSPEELEIFVVMWNRFIAQFKEDVLHTEEMQILDLIKLEVMLNRLLKQQTFIQTDIIKLEGIVSKLEYEENPDTITIAQEKMKLQSLRASYDSLSREIRDTIKQKQSLFQNLKATRADRIQKIDGKQTFNLWLQSLTNDYELRKRMGLDMEKMRLASEAEKRRLSEYHTFANRELDRPFLNADTVENDAE